MGCFLVIFLGSSGLSIGLSLLFPQQTDKRPFIIAATFGAALSALLVGPSYILGFPNSSVLMAGGLFLLGGFRGLICSLAIPESLAGAVAAFPDLPIQATDRTFSVYYSLFGLVMGLFPLSASALNKSLGFRVFFDIFSALMLLIALLFTGSCLYDYTKEKSRE